MPDGWVPTPEILLGAIAGVTEAARIGTNVTLLTLQNPIQVAERAAVLDVLTSGRMRLGVSIGWREPEFAGFGIDRAERVPRLVERPRPRQTTPPRALGSPSTGSSTTSRTSP